MPTRRHLLKAAAALLACVAAPLRAVAKPRDIIRIPCKWQEPQETQPPYYETIYRVEFVPTASERQLFFRGSCGRLNAEPVTIGDVQFPARTLLDCGVSFTTGEPTRDMHLTYRPDWRVNFDGWDGHVYPYTFAKFEPMSVRAEKYRVWDDGVPGPWITL